MAHVFPGNDSFEKKRRALRASRLCTELPWRFATKTSQTSAHLAKEGGAFVFPLKGPAFQPPFSGGHFRKKNLRPKETKTEKVGEIRTWICFDGDF